MGHYQALRKQRIAWLGATDTIFVCSCGPFSSRKPLASSIPKTLYRVGQL